MPVISQDNIITIPKEIFETSNLKLSKPIYLYNNGSVSWLENKKRKYDCYGTIQLDDNLSFIVSNNFINALGSKFAEHKEFFMYTVDKIIHFRAVNSPGIFSKYAPLKSQIPTELIQTSKVDFNKTVYLLKNSSYYNPIAILSNKRYSDASCLGEVHLDNEGFVTFSLNMCTALSLIKVSDYSWVISDKDIVFRRSSN